MDTVFVFLAGALSWTFLEYGLHYWVFHLGRGRNLGSREHLRHHADPSYFSPLYLKLISAAAVLTATYFLVGLIAPELALPYASGIGVGYGAYERYHWHLHVAGPRTRFGAFLRKQHFHHHFVAPLRNHGVTSAVWDRIFRTHVPPEGLIPVPRKHAHALPWVLGPDGAIAPQHAADYELR